MKFLFRHNSYWLIIGNSLVLAVILNLLWDTLRGELILLGESYDVNSVLLLVSLVLLFFAWSYYFDKYMRGLYLLHTIDSTTDTKPRKVLICFLSLSNQKLTVDHKPIFSSIKREDGSSYNPPELTGNSLESDLQLLNQIKEETKDMPGTGGFVYWNWSQLLIAVNSMFQKGKLEKVVIVGSDTPDKWGNNSSSQLTAASAILRNYFAGIKIETERIKSFEDFEIAHDSLQSIINKMKQEGYKEKDIMIDITGGQKTCSVAAASVSICSSSRMFQYVTNGGELKYYNIEIQKRKDDE